jgi:hypothetical protein
MHCIGLIRMDRHSRNLSNDNPRTLLLPLYIWGKYG